MRKLFVLVLLLFSGVITARSDAFADNWIAPARGLSAMDQVNNSEVTDALTLVFEDPEYYPEDSPDKPNSSKASKISQSRRHTGSRSQSYQAPNSSSLRAGSLGSSRGTPSPSILTQTRAQGKPSLRMSHRDRYFGVGSREFGFNIGTAHGFTDLQGSKGLGFGESLQFQVKNPGFTLGLYTKLRMVDWFGLSLGFDYGRVSGEGDNTLGPYEGYSFENNLVEFNARLAFYAPLASVNIFDIYAFAGLALFSNNLNLYDPEGFTVDTEGSFSKLQPAIPFGIGLSGLVGSRVVIGYELGYRYTSFNYLDGIAPVDTRYDGYLFNNIKIGFILKPRGK
ncbi:MAG: DUF6089 family protein [Bacteroides sp.]|jgi:hypothetical protein|nr:DUF6089 family protein [Bacteroides sp.]